MSDDQGFRRALRADPDDTVTRSVYADWLEERGDPRGTFLRLEAELTALPADDERRSPLQDRLRELQPALDVAWLAELDRTKIENCLRFTFQCPQQWEKLLPTKGEQVRYCAVCERNVFHCHTIDQARTMARMDRCVAVDSRLAREEGDLGVGQPMGMMLGRIAPEPFVSPFQVGDRVRILDGPFRGVESQVRSVNEWKGTAEVEVSLFAKTFLSQFPFFALERCS
jgi:uncharacterized protein (TIGR02996 family)